MSLEREIKDAFVKHQDDVRVRDGFEQVETKVRRSHARRTAAFGAFAIAAIVAGAVLTTGMLSDDAPRGFDNPGVSPSPAPATQTKTYFDTLNGWQMTFPATWRVTRFEEETEFLPPGMVGTTAGDETFAVNVQWGGISSGGPMKTSPDPSTTEPPLLLGEEIQIGRFTANRTVNEPDRDVAYSFSWCIRSDSDEYPNECTMGELHIAILASTQQLWDAYHARAEEMLPSLDHAYGEDIPTTEIVTRNGSVADGIGGGETTYRVIKFLEARMDGVGAEKYLTDNARSQYGSDTSGVGLYEDGLRGEPDDRWTTYAVVERAEADANSSEYLIELTTAGDLTVRERIGVGFDGDDILVRFAQREES